MPSIPLHPPQHTTSATEKEPLTTSLPTNPLPHLLQTPSGLALLEIQGTLHTPAALSNLTSSYKDNDKDDDDSAHSIQETPVGRLVFPLYSPDQPEKNQAWMKRIYLYVGKHQRLTGEVRKLPKAIAVVRRCERGANAGTAIATDVMELDGQETAGAEGEEEKEGSRSGEELEIVDIVKYKILFAGRPEPVGGGVI